MSATKEKLTQSSRVRQLYTKIEGDLDNSYKCNLCAKTVNGKSSSNLSAHIKNVHNEVFKQKVKPDDEDDIKLQRLKFVHSCVELVTVNSHPLSLLSQSGFRSAVGSVLRKFQLAGCSLNLSDHHVYEIKEKIRETAGKIKEQIKSEVSGKLISVMVDTAKRNDRAIFGISLQYKYNGILKIATIGMCELKESQTAEYLADVLVVVLAKYGISLAQILSITTDNGANMLKMVKDIECLLLNTVDNPTDSDRNSTQLTNEWSADELNECNIDEEIENELKQRQLEDENVLDILLDECEIYDELFDKLVSGIRNKTSNEKLPVISIKCAAHTLQLAVKDSLKLIAKKDRNLIELCREVAKFLRLGSTKNEMRRLGLTSILPALDVSTRWSSTFMMVINN